jgi:CheY-like chemotaxis protein
VVVPQEQKVRVLVVDDDPDFVEAAKVSLAADRRIEVVGGAASGEEAVKQAAALRPEVVAMDVVMPGLDGLEATRLIRKDRPECRVVLVSGSIFVDREMRASKRHVRPVRMLSSREPCSIWLRWSSPSLAAPGTCPRLRHEPDRSGPRRPCQAQCHARLVELLLSARTNQAPLGTWRRYTHEFCRT